MTSPSDPLTFTCPHCLCELETSADDRDPLTVLARAAQLADEVCGDLGDQLYDNALGSAGELFSLLEAYLPKAVGS